MGEGVDLLSSTFVGEKVNAANNNDVTSHGIITEVNYTSKIATSFINAIAQHRFREREAMSKVPA